MGLHLNILLSVTMHYLEGDGITEEHILGQASVAVMGVDVADKLFGRRDGIDR